MGQVSPIWPVMGLNCPWIGREESSAITGLAVIDSSWISFATSYSRNSSRSAWNEGMAPRPSVELLPARPKYSDSPGAPVCTGCSPDSAARSSSSEKGCGSITRRRILPRERAASSSRNSRTRFAYGMISGARCAAVSREK